MYVYTYICIKNAYVQKSALGFGRHPGSVYTAP